MQLGLAMRLPSNPWPSIAIILYWISVLVPAVVLHTGPILFGSSRDDLVVGAVCIAFGWFTPAWYANLVLLTAAVAHHHRNYGLALALSLIAIGDALSVVVFPMSDIRPHVGYVLWVASMAAMAIASAESLRHHVLRTRT